MARARARLMTFCCTGGNIKRIVVLSVLVLAAASAQAQPTSPARPAVGADGGALRQQLECWRIEHGLPAVAAAVVTGDSVLDISTVGVRRLGTEDSVRLEDRFHIGSNAKAMTGFVAGVLVERGLIGWDTKILDLLPGPQDSACAEYRGKTLLDLLSHRAGIVPLMSGADLKPVPAFEGDIGARRLAFANWLLQQPPAGPDDVLGYRYSNGGYALAAAMLEQAAARTWERLMTDELFALAGIDGQFGWPAHNDPFQPWGHYYDADSGRLIPHDPHDEYQLPDILAAAGDVCMSIGDYARFLQLNLLGLAGRDTVVRAATCRFLHAGADTAAKYAVGWRKEEYQGLRVSRHNGSAGTFYCTALVFRDRNLALGIVVNAAPPGIAEAVAVLASEILKRRLN